jgi:hypothetical protein
MLKNNFCAFCAFLWPIKFLNPRTRILPMNDLLTWALHRARQQTLTLVEDLREDQMCLQASPGENHPAWILGHLLLSDVYLLHLLKVQPLSQDFEDLLRKYGPASTPVPSIEHYEPKPILVERLTHTGARRLAAIEQLSVEELRQPTPDEILAQAQPTIAHHLQALIFHEGHHGGQLSAWRKAQRLASIRGAFAPPIS